MHDDWKIDKASESQIRYIKGLMIYKERNTLNINLENLSKGEASSLIKALLYDNDEKLVNKRTLKIKTTPMIKEEFLYKYKEVNKKKLSCDNHYLKVKYKVIGRLHLWVWESFKEEINGIIIDYDITGNSINSITYEVEKEIDDSILRKYGLKAEKVE